MAQLLPETRKLLESTEERFEDIASGSGVRLSWLYMFARGEIPNPGVNHVQKVHDYLVRPKTAARAKRASSALTV